MERCPQCNKVTLIYDSWKKQAKCIETECGYEERDIGELRDYYSAHKPCEENMVHKLSRSINESKK